MGRSLALWTKTLSFPSRNSPNKSSKHSITTSINTSSCTIFAPATPTKDKTTPASTPDVSVRCPPIRAGRVKIDYNYFIFVILTISMYRCRFRSNRRRVSFFVFFFGFRNIKTFYNNYCRSNLLNFFSNSRLYIIRYLKLTIIMGYRFFVLSLVL